MKIITIGDIHGNQGANWAIWQPAIDRLLNGEFDKAIFLGDYVDHWTTGNHIIYNNLSDIIKIKKKYPDKIILLWGNHELNYALTPAHVDNPYACSGYRGDMHVDLYELFQENYDLFQLAYQYENYLWTHAGLHQGWWDFDYPYSRTNFQGLADTLNRSFNTREPSIFQVGWRRGGFKDVGGPLWADKLLTSQKPLKGLHQIVGHSRVDAIQTFEKNKDTSITFCDCLDGYNEEFKDKYFYELEI